MKLQLLILLVYKKCFDVESLREEDGIGNSTGGNGWEWEKFVGTAWEWNRENVPVQNSNCCALMKMVMVVVMIIMMEIVLMILIRIHASCCEGLVLRLRGNIIRTAPCWVV